MIHLSPTTIQQEIQQDSNPNHLPRKDNKYFNIYDLLILFNKNIFLKIKSSEHSEPFEDKWSAVNRLRSFVSPALNKGISEIIRKNLQDEHAVIIEIGSGIGYTLSKELQKNLVKTQPCVSECQLLVENSLTPVYQLDINGIYHHLITSEKKISLFFALNVFDTLSSPSRKLSFLQISRLQNINDRLLIMLDVNPLLNTTIEHLMSLHPGHLILPYYPLEETLARFSVMIVPEEFFRKLTLDELIEVINNESLQIIKKQTSELQYRLRQFKKQFNYKVITLEDFFSEQIKSELMEVGYHANSYYHHSFVQETLPKELSEIKGNFVYKPVTDAYPVRQYYVTDEKRLQNLFREQLDLPYFNLNEMKQNNQKIFGAEILVIEATKI